MIGSSKQYKLGGWKTNVTDFANWKRKLQQNPEMGRVP